MDIFSLLHVHFTMRHFYIIKRNWIQKLLILVIDVYYGTMVYSVSNIIEIKIENSIAVIKDGMPYNGGYGVAAFAVTTAFTMPLMYHLMRTLQESLKYMDKHFVCRSGIFIAAEVVWLILFVYSSISAYDPRYIWNLICYTCANFLAIFMLFDSIHAIHERKRAENSLHMFELEYHAIDNNIQEMRRFDHDMHHHFNVISTLNAEGKSEELNRYLEQYTTVYENLENNKICNYALIDTILKYYVEKCKREHILVDTDIALNEDLGFDFMDMTVLLGNCLENAIEANMLLDERKRYIHIQMMKIKRAVLIMLENNCPFHRAVQGGEFIALEPQHTTKNDKSHGFGMKSILNIVQKYDGCAEYQQLESSFALRIVLYIP